MRGLGTIFKQKNSRYLWMQYFVDGKRRRESTGRELLKDAKNVLRAKLLELQEQDAIAAGHTAPATVGGLYSLILDDYEMNGRKSVKHLRGMWAKHLAPYFAGIPTAKLTSDQVVEYVRRRQAAGAANGSINRELAALKRMYRIALKAGRLKLVPHIGLLQERNIRKGFLRDADYDALARETASRGPWLRALFELAYTFGWRKTELTRMRVRQVDAAERTIELNPGETKNDEGRVVTMTRSTWALIEPCIRGKSADELVFTRENGKPAGNFRRSWASACRAAGTPGLLFHDLRRSGVRNMRRAGISEKVAMRISGHKTRSVFERYNIVDPADLQEATLKLEQGAERRSRIGQGSGTSGTEIGA
jgi:integrase